MITTFKDEYRFLSNFWPARVMLDGIIYPSVEHAYVAAKTTDKEIRKKIQNTYKAGDVKRLGRTFTLRDNWDLIKFQVMSDLVWQKFQHEELKQLLLATGDQEIIEGNTWGDVYWGVCRGEGQNNLGKILMRVREELKA